MLVAVNDHGAPEHLTCDGAAVQVGRKTTFHKSLQNHDIECHVSAPRRPNEKAGSEEKMVLNAGKEKHAQSTA